MCAWKRKHEAEVAAAGDTAESQSKQSQESPPIEAGGNDESKSGSKKRKKFGNKCPPNADVLRVVNAMMARPPNPEVCFDPHPDANPPSRADGLLRLVA